MRFNISSTSSAIEGVDNGGVSSYQPLVVGGSTVTLATAGASAITIDGSQRATLAAQLFVIAGSASACGVAFSGDSDTGIAQLGGANTLSLVTNEAERLQINADGNAIFTRPGEYALVMRRTDTGVTNNFISAITYDAKNASGTYHSYCRLITQQTDATAGTESGQFYLQVRNNGTERSYVLIDGESDTVKLLTGGSERVRVDSTGNVGIGIGTTTVKARLQTSGASAASPSLGSATGSFLVTNNDTGYGMQFGVESSGVGWIQQGRTDGNVTAYNLRLQPAGGQVLVPAGSGDSGSYKPGVAVSGDDDTGIQQIGGSNLLSVVCAGVERVRFGVVNRTTVYGNGERFGLGVAFDTTGASVYFGANSNTQTPDAAISNSNGVILLLAKDNGKVIVGGTTDQGTYNLQCNGTGVWGAGAYVNGSDARIKDDITPLGEATSVITAMQPVTFRYKATWSSDQSIQPGFVAQQLQEALAGTPYLNGVVQQGTEYLSVAYQSLIPLLVKALQESNARIAALEQRINA